MQNSHKLRYIIIFLFLYLLFLPANMVFANAPVISSDLEQLDFANGLFQRRLYKMARDEYSKFIDSFKQSKYLSEAYFGRAESSFFLKDYHSAIEQYKEYLRLFPKGEKVELSKMRLGQSFLFLKDYTSAIEYFSSINSMALDESFRQILIFCKGKAYLGKGDKDKAIKSFDEAVAILKGSRCAVNALIEAGGIFANEHKIEVALKYYDRAFNNTNDRAVKSLILYKKGEAYFLNKDYFSAIQVFGDILDKYSDEDVARDAFSNLLLSLYNLSKYEDLLLAYKKYKDIIKGKDGFFNICYIVASTYADLSQYKDAEAVLDEVLSTASLNEQERNKAILKKAEILVKSKQMREAIELLDKELPNIVEGQDKRLLLEAEAYYGLANFYKSYKLYIQITDKFPSSNLADDALYGAAHAKKAVGDNKEAMELFFKYFQQGKDISKRRESLYNDILLAIGEGMTERAVKHSELYLDKFENWYRSELVMFRLANLYGDLKEYDKAIDILKNFISKYPKSARLNKAYFLLGYDLQMIGRKEEALQYYKKIDFFRTSDDFKASSLKNMALIYLDKGEEQLAAELYNKIITELNGCGLNIKAYIWLAEKYINEDNLDKALNILEQAKKKDVDGKGDLEISYFMGVVYRKKKEYQKAIKYYDIVLSSGISNVYTGASYIGKGLSLFALKRYSDARKEFEKAIVEYPDDATITMRARFEIANLEAERGNIEEAYKFYMLVAVLYNDDVYCPEALFRAGRIFEQLKKREDAIKVYKEIVDVYSQSDLAAEARQRLKSLVQDNL